MTREKMQNHLSNLQEKLKTLKEDCKEAYARGDDLGWEVLKKKKLKLKDEIESCKRQLSFL